MRESRKKKNVFVRWNFIARGDHLSPSPRSEAGEVRRGSPHVRVGSGVFEERRTKYFIQLYFPPKIALNLSKVGAPKK